MAKKSKAYWAVYNRVCKKYPNASGQQKHTITWYALNKKK